MRSRSIIGRICNRFEKSALCLEFRVMRKSCQDLPLSFSLAVGERKWSEGTEGANCGAQSAAERRGAESETEAADECRFPCPRPGRAGAEWSALATAGRGVGPASGRQAGTKRQLVRASSLDRSGCLPARFAFAFLPGFVGV